MYNRLIDIEKRLDETMFFFGARQTGKSTLLKERFPDVIFFDLLDSDLRRRFQNKPSLLKEILHNCQPGELIVIDEIQKVPDLLDIVHSLMVEKDLNFILSGSSARKLKRSGANTLGGRAIPEMLFPLVSAEIPDFNLQRALQNGMLPRHYGGERHKEDRSVYRCLSPGRDCRGGRREKYRSIRALYGDCGNLRRRNHQL